MGQVCFPVLQFLPVSIIPPMLCAHLHPPPTPYHLSNVGTPAVTQEALLQPADVSTTHICKLIKKVDGITVHEVQAYTIQRWL